MPLQIQSILRRVVFFLDKQDTRVYDRVRGGDNSGCFAHAVAKQIVVSLNSWKGDVATVKYRVFWIALSTVALMALALLPASGEGTDPALLLKNAQSFLDAGKRNDARTALSSVVENYPNSAQAPKAQLMLAYMAVKDAPPSAESAFDLVVAKYPDSGEAIAALYRKGKLRVRDGDRTDAIAVFKLGYERGKDGQSREFAAMCYVDAGLEMLAAGKFPKNETMIQSALDWLKDADKCIGYHPREMSKAHLRVAQYYLYVTKEYDAARAELERVVSSYESNYYTPAAKYELAYIAYDQRDFDLCLHTMQGYIDEGIADKGWVAYMRFVIGDCYWRLNDKQMAKQTWESVVQDYPGTEFSDIASKALQVIDPIP